MTTGRTVDEFRNAHDPYVQIERLEADLKRAQRESADAAAIKSLIGTVALALDEASPPEWAQKATKDSGHPGVPTLLLSDLHWGEVVHPSQINNVNSYNLTVARARLRHVVETSVDLLRIIDPEMRYPGIVVPLGGDMISGNIHEELQATNELNTMPTVLDLYEHLVAAIRLLADAFGNVFLPCVSGNHGRDTRKTWAKDRTHTSFDWLLYQFLAKAFESDARVRFMVPDGPDALYSIYGTKYLLTHGDRLGHGGDGLIGFLGPVLRGDHKRRSRQSQVSQPYDVLLCGHWHQYVHMTRVVVNGSLKGYDEYAFTESFPFEVPSQALWVTHPVHGPTFRAPIFCDQGKATKPGRWVSEFAT